MRKRNWGGRLAARAVLTTSLRPGVLLVAVLAAWSAPGVVRAQEAVLQFDIDAQPLGSALRVFAAQARQQILFDEDRSAGLRAPALRGRHTVRDALDGLLDGTGIQVVASSPGVFTLRWPDRTSRPRVPASAESLAAVTVTARAIENDTTQGTGSYAASRVSLGKGQTLRETPQSVTVVTRQRIEDQGLSSVGDVMQQTTGITVVAGNGGEAANLYSRGFQLTSMQVDGAPVDAFSQNFFNPNLAMYDSVQVVRGADGLFAGNGEPGGSINLVRKRPTPERQMLATLGAGSWNQRRAELDAAGPLAWEGRVRGRTVLAHEDREFHYDLAGARKSLLYGIVETDLTPDTVLTLGASYEKTNSRPWSYGLPRATSGADLGLPRDTALMASWNRYGQISRELFAQLDQQLGGDWALHIKAGTMRIRSHRLGADGTGAIDADTGMGLQMSSWGFDHASVKKTLDANAGGSFALLGRRHHLLVGGDWQQVRHREAFSNVEYAEPPPAQSIHGFSPDAIAFPSKIWMYNNWPAYGATQKGLYTRLRLSLTDRLTAIAGARYAHYTYESPNIRTDRDGHVTATSRTGYTETGVLTPYGGLVYDIDARWTAYASAASIHKVQSNRLQGPLPGDPVDAIVGRNYEAGVKGALLGGRLNAALALYRIERKGEAVRDPAYPSTGVGDLGLNCCWLPLGEVVSQGIDAEISGELAAGWQLFAGYTFNRNRNKATHAAYHSVTPRHLFRLWTTYRLPGDLADWTLGGGVNAQSVHFVGGTARSYNPTSGAFDGATVPFNYAQRGYAVWGASVQYRLHRHWTATLNLNNLFDKIYYKSMGTSASGNWYGEPRNAMFTLRGTF